jgi:hypothetical protein
LNFMSPSLTANNVWLGNASNIASPIAVPTCAANNYLTFDGTAFSCAVDAGASGAVTSLATTAPLATTGATGAITLSMGLTDGHIYVGNASNLATDVAMTGDATISNAGALTLATVATAGTYSQVTVNTKGLVTAGANPTTLAGYGITDAVKNAGGTPSVYSGAAQPGTPATGDLYVDTTNKKWQRYNGATWDDLGTAGALTNVTASAPLQSSGGTTPAISFANQAQNSVLAGPTSGTGAPTFRSLVAADLPALTTANLPALASGTFWLGNASGVTTAQSMSGDATMTGAGLVSVTGISGKTISAAPTTPGQVLQYNGTSWVPTVPTSLSSTLTSGHIFMGNSSNVAVDTTLSGDVTFTGGATKVTALQNIPVVAGTPTTNQVLQYNGTSWAPATFSGGTTISGGTQNHLAKFNAAGTNVVDSSVTDDGTYVQVTKVFRGPASVSNASTSINFSTGNIQYTSSSCGAMTLTNMKDGATYTLAVQGTSVGTCVFTAYSDSGTTSVSVLYPPDFGSTTPTYQTLFSFVVVNSTAYVTWIPGYHP